MFSFVKGCLMHFSYDFAKHLCRPTLTCKKNKQDKKRCVGGLKLNRMEPI